MTTLPTQELQCEDDGRPTLVVRGIYDKDEIPRLDKPPKDYSLKDLASDQIMVRKRLQGPQRFVPEHGLVSESMLEFYHQDLVLHRTDFEYSLDESDPFDYPLERPDRIYDERSILIQSFEHYQKVRDHKSFSSLLPNDLNDVFDDVRFGENMIVSGLDNDEICIGDVFEVQGDDSSLKLQVSSPRLPCSHVDKKNGAKFGMEGLRRYTMSEGLAGWFVRVLEPGTIQDGTKLVRTQNPHPKWTLRYVSHALYAEGDRKHFLMGWAQWARSKEELAELCSLPAFGWHEWKAEAQWLLDRWGQKGVMVEPEMRVFTPPSATISSSSKSTRLVLGSSDSFYTARIVPSHLRKRFSYMIAAAIFGLAWLTLGLTLVTHELPTYK